MEVLPVLRGLVGIVLDDRDRVVRPTEQELLHRVAVRGPEAGGQVALLVAGEGLVAEDEHAPGGQGAAELRAPLVVDGPQIDARDLGRGRAREGPGLEEGALRHP